MNRILSIITAIIISIHMTACKSAEDVQTAPEKNDRTAAENSREEKEEKIMYIRIGEKVLTADLADNSSADAFKQLLLKGDITVGMSDYGNFEKVGDLGVSLPRNDTQITTEAGDIILYLGNKITIYYDTNSWDFTRLGKIRDVSREELKNILGEGDVTVTFSAGGKE